MKISKEEVFRLAVLQRSEEEIATLTGCDKTELAKFEKIILHGNEAGKLAIMQHLMSMSRHNAAVAVLLAKNFLGMTDKPVDGEDNYPALEKISSFIQEIREGGDITEKKD